MHNSYKKSMHYVTVHWGESGISETNRLKLINSTIFVCTIPTKLRFNEMSQIFHYFVRSKMSYCKVVYCLMGLYTSNLYHYDDRKNTYHNQLLDNPSPVLKQNSFYYLWGKGLFKNKCKLKTNQLCFETIHILLLGLSENNFSVLFSFWLASSQTYL